MPREIMTLAQGDFPIAFRFVRVSPRDKTSDKGPGIPPVNQAGILSRKSMEPDGRFLE